MMERILAWTFLAILVWVCAAGAVANEAENISTISTDESYASGNMTFLTDHPAIRDLLVPEGTKVFAVREVDPPASQQKIYFETTESGIIKAGQSEVTVPCRAIEPGPASNVAAYEIRCIESYLMGIYKCENREPVVVKEIESCSGQLHFYHL